MSHQPLSTNGLKGLKDSILQWNPREERYQFYLDLHAFGIFQRHKHILCHPLSKCQCHGQIFDWSTLDHWLQMRSVSDINQFSAVSNISPIVAHFSEFGTNKMFDEICVSEVLSLFKRFRENKETFFVKDL